MGYPVIFVHGVGASETVWKRKELPGHRAFYLSFLNRFANPADQVPELKKFINEVLRSTGEEKVILVCHSMGGLVARRYLAEAKSDHRVGKLVLLSTPNLGSVGLSFNWLPLSLIILGLCGYRFFWPLLLSMAGLLWELVSLSRGVLLLSPAVWAMRPGSKFLKELNSKDMAEDVKYVCVLSDTKFLPHRLVNFFLFREGGDGAVALSSQKLSDRCVPNFSALDYREIFVDLPHFAIPKKAHSAILEALADI